MPAASAHDRDQGGDRPGLLFLAHRIPYPPDKGDKIRAWHLLRHLARRYRVHLGAFVDDPSDWRHADTLASVCASSHLVDLRPRRARLRALGGLWRGEALTLPYYRHAGLQAWVDRCLADGTRRVLAYSSAMARFVMHARGVRRVMDFVDIDSDKWRQYAPTRRWPMSWLYRREAEKLLAWERRVAAEFDASLFVSAAEADDFRRLAPESAGKVSYFHNGVDAEYFSPAHALANPYDPGQEVVVFTGMMDYWPNVDAVTWFADQVLPRLRRQRPALSFAIVGARPAAEVRALVQREGVRVTGRVDDVRPYLAHARVVVAPLRIARGIQNKVLEGMAMARPVVATAQALEGIGARVGEEVLSADTADEFVAAVSAAAGRDDLGPAARARVLRDFAWDDNLARVDTLLEGSPA